MKIGRNQSCPCGSGRKYKHCCYMKDASKPTAQEIAQVIKELQEKELLSVARKAELRTHGIFIDFVVPLPDFQGKSVWALGSRFYPRERPGISFHEFLVSCLAQELGNEWINHQYTLELKKRHFIMQCHHHFAEFVQRVSNQVGSGGWAAYPDGWSKSLLSLAFDVACIIHVHGHLPAKIVHRLKLSDSNYQGARYEIAVAAIFARMGCKFEFLDEILDDLPEIPGHCEFYVTEPTTNIKIAVEAKSKRRKGIIHEPGLAHSKQLWSNVTGPYRDALKQNPDTMPFMIFVDVNCPPSPDVNFMEKNWVKQVLENRERTTVNKPENLDPCSAMVYTNHSYHYQTDQEAITDQPLMVVPNYAKYPLPEAFIQRMNATIGGYNYIPNIGYDGTVQS